MTIKTGMNYTLTHRVLERDLATAWENDVAVLATPILLWLAERACMEAIDSALPPDNMTLGYGHNVKHLAPTPLDWQIEISAHLKLIDGNLLTFDIEAQDDQEIILSGNHVRAVVCRDKFMQKVEKKYTSITKP